MDRLTALQDPRNSLVYWHSAARCASVPMPKTVLYSPADPTLAEWGNKIRAGERYVPAWIAEIAKLAGEDVGFPLFMRTDQAASKHKGEKTCLVHKPEDLGKQLDQMIFDQLGLLGTPRPEAIVLREHLPPASLTSGEVMVMPFRAFGPSAKLPIGAERRYFVRNAKVECHHPYWPEEAIKDVDPAVTDWQARLSLFNYETDDEVKLLSYYANALGTLLPGYWSFDFMLTEKDWLFIDAGMGECSAHLPCPFNVSVR